MGFEASYGFRRLQGSEEDYDKFLKKLEEKTGNVIADAQGFFGRWYWDDAKEQIREASRDFPSLLVEISGEVNDCEYSAWLARVKNGEIEEAGSETVYEAFRNGNLIPESDDPEVFTRDFVENTARAIAFELIDKSKALLRKPYKWDSTLFRGKKIFGMLLLRTVLEKLADEYGPVEEDLNSKEGKKVKSMLEAELLNLG